MSTSTLSTARSGEMTWLTSGSVLPAPRSRLIGLAIASLPLILQPTSPILVPDFMLGDDPWRDVAVPDA